MANELTDEGLEVMAIERGPWRDAPTDFPPASAWCEVNQGESNRLRHAVSPASWERRNRQALRVQCSATVCTVARYS